MWATVVLATLSLALYVFYRRRCRLTSIFHEMGVPGPEPHWLLGNFGSFHKRLQFEVLREWKKKYGNTFGYYEGPTPVLCTSDLDVLQEVCIKQFSKFHGRKIFPVGPDPDKDKIVNMFSARGQRWKRLRTIINPTFSMAKLKQMAPQMNVAISRLLKKLGRACDDGKPFNIYKYYQALTLEVIGECACGLHTDAQSNQDDLFLKCARAIFDMQDKVPKIVLLGVIVPELRRILWVIRQVAFRIVQNPVRMIMKMMETVIEDRRKEKLANTNKGRFTDLLQLLLDAEDTSFDYSAQPDSFTMPSEEGQEVTDDVTPRVKATNGTKANLKAMTKEEALSQSVLFLLAGYETTSTALAYVTYILAKHPDIQEKLAQEIQQYIRDKEEPSYEDVRKIEYLEMVLHETLRVYPIGAQVITRMCMQECTVGGYKLKPGVIVHANLWCIHNDPEIWPNPELFQPERFSAANSQGRHPLAWIPFGAGPRNCVGLRFAMMEAKIAICRILSEFRIEWSQQTPDPLPLRQSGTITPKGGVVIKLSRRNKSV